MERKKIDILLWGVTGWTGVHLLEHFARSHPLNLEKPMVIWAVVSRNSEKLENAIKQVADSLNVPWLHNVQRFIVDNTKLEEVQRVVPLARCVATVVGPYAQFGENLIKVCAETGTHYCDITGESVWVKKMLDKYNQTAQKTGSIILPFCGNDCIPSDMNAFAAARALDTRAKELFGVPNVTVEKKMAMEGFLIDMDMNNRHKNGPMGGGGTVASVLGLIQEKESFAQMNKYNLLSEEDTVNTVDAHSRPQFGVWRNSKIGKWTTHYVMAVINGHVVRRSRYLLPHVFGSTLAYKEALALNYAVNALGVTGLFTLAYPALKLSLVRKQLQKYAPNPSTFPNPLPPADKYKPGKFEFVTLAEGEYKVGNEVKKLECKVTFKTPDEIGWTYTSIFLGECAVALAKSSLEIKEFSRQTGGFLTTACLGEVLLQRLRSQKVEIKIDQVHAKL